MNQFLANALGRLNSLLAIVIVVGPAIVSGAGISMSQDAGVLGFLGGIIAGGLVGIVLAIVICGLLALLVSINENLTEIRRLLTSAKIEPEDIQGKRTVQLPPVLPQGKRKVTRFTKWG